MAVPHGASPRRVRVRDLAPARLQAVGGVNTWGEITVDAKRGIAYFPIGSPTYDYYGADRGAPTCSAVPSLALDARTGKRLWHFQMVHHDLWDFDGNAAPQLTTIRRNGKTIDVVAYAGKTGFLYVFDRVTGVPIWPIEERPVPKSDMPGEHSWPTQPFPTAPPPFSKQAFTVDDINPYPVITETDRERFKERLARTRNQGLFTPNQFDDTLHIPGSNGGALFGYTASEPRTAGSTSSARTIRRCCNSCRLRHPAFPGSGRTGAIAGLPRCR